MFFAIGDSNEYTQKLNAIHQRNVMHPFQVMKLEKDENF